MSQVKRRPRPRPAQGPKPKKKKGALKKVLLALLVAAVIAGATVLIVGYVQAHRHYLPTILPEVTETEAPAEAEE